MVLLRSKAIRTVLLWQACVTAAMSAAAVVMWGRHAGISALLGGLVSMVSGAVYAVVARTGRASSPGAAVRAALQAEAAKITAVVFLLWLVLSLYKDVVALGFLTVFAVTIVVFSAAIAVRDT